MKTYRAIRKIEKAIDAIVDLQQDYHDECITSEITNDLQRALGLLNHCRNNIQTIDYRP